MKVLMIGATGSNAGAVLPELVKRGVTVRALVRDEDRAALARRRGAAETVVADLGDPANLRAAVEGADAVFHVNPAFAPREAEMGVALVEAARAARVRKFVFSGVIHPSISAMVNHAAKQPVEEALYTSGMDFTVLQPAMFMQNLAALWPEVAEEGRLSMPYSVSAEVCWVDYRDVAEAAALALTGDRLSHGTFELCAPGMVDRVRMAQMISEELGRPVEAVETPLRQWAERLPQGPERDGLTRMFAHYDEHGFPGGNALVLRAVLGREPRSLSAYFHELATRAP
ncbi:NmrA family NAD(P)-binding protein [Streptomyces winkii]|uniref:NmrA family NAD(P)-binding protein n=1 Tax=Streptomyces winkii TaxID=3051178 RepID=UPI0028D58CB5|nr:NmrA family NAD(P)-binding protein [Streptomyces sp. DSM 40971]